MLPDLRCPATGSPLSLTPDGSALVNADGRAYPVIDGIPVLLAEERSLFDIADVKPRSTGNTETMARGGLARLWSKLPSLSRNVGSERNYAALAEMLEERKPLKPRVLVVGGQIAGVGSGALLGRGDIDLVETDVDIGPRTHVVCDAHDLPFADQTFDAVVCQAVLEHVIDPYRAAAEIHRVLADDGLVYSEIPFIQQVHGGIYDFTRFTHLGHRRLWRHFDEVRSGVQGGPGMALAWSIQYFLLAIAGSRRAFRGIARLLSLSAVWLKYADGVLAARPGGADAASGTFFLGRRRDTSVPDREIVRAFRGNLPRGQRLPTVHPTVPAATNGGLGKDGQHARRLTEKASTTTQ
jgi:SAM-dependent methyltransferase